MRRRKVGTAACGHVPNLASALYRVKSASEDVPPLDEDAKSAELTGKH